MSSPQLQGPTNAAPFLHSGIVILQPLAPAIDPSGLQTQLPRSHSAPLPVTRSPLIFEESECSSSPSSGSNSGPQPLSGPPPLPLPPPPRDIYEGVGCLGFSLRTAMMMAEHQEARRLDKLTRSQMPKFTEITKKRKLVEKEIVKNYIELWNNKIDLFNETEKAIIEMHAVVTPSQSEVTHFPLSDDSSTRPFSPSSSNEVASSPNLVAEARLFPSFSSPGSPRGVSPPSLPLQPASPSDEGASLYSDSPAIPPSHCASPQEAHATNFQFPTAPALISQSSAPRSGIEGLTQGISPCPSSVPSSFEGGSPRRTPPNLPDLIDPGAAAPSSSSPLGVVGGVGLQALAAVVPVGARSSISPGSDNSSRERTPTAGMSGGGVFSPTGLSVRMS